MTVYNLTQCPSAASISLIANTALYASPLIGSAQTLDRQGMKWKFVYTFDNVSGDERAQLMGLIAIVRGQANRFRVDVYDNPRRGAYGGTPLVAGAGQSGMTLNIDGATPSVTDWIMFGDYFSVTVNGIPELKMATSNASSNGSGAVVLSFQPRLRASPADNATIQVEDGVLATPRGIFVLESAENGWTSRPNSNGPISNFTLNMIEDVFATQA